jgi:hypothetical protein
MKAKRAATVAAKKALVEASGAVEAVKASETKVRKPREKMTEEQKAAMKAKRQATIAAKKDAPAPAPAPADADADAPVEEAPKPKGKGRKAKATTPPPVGNIELPPAPKKGKKRTAAEAEPKAASPPTFYEMAEVDDALFMVHKESKKAYRVDMNETGDARALLDQQVGLFQDGEILPVYDEED